MFKIHQIFFLISAVSTIVVLTVGSYITYWDFNHIHKNQIEHKLDKSIQIIKSTIQNNQDLNQTIYILSQMDITEVLITENNQSRFYPKHFDIDENNIYQLSLNFNYNENQYKIVIQHENMNITKAYLNYWTEILIIYLIVMGVSTYFYRRFDKQISEDFKKILDFLDQAINKKFKNKSKIKIQLTKDLDELLPPIKKLVADLEQKQKQKRKHTAKLRLLNQQRNNVISAISHEFKNPLSAIIGYTQTLEEESENFTDIQKKFLTKITDNSNKISNLINRLSLSINLENKDFSPTITKFNLTNLVEDVIANIQSKYKTRKIIFENKEEVIIEADKMLIELVLINLADNALKYSHEEINIYFENDNLYVEDYGYGIASSELKNITKKFYRINKFQWDNSMGMGLFLVDYILKLHNTKLSIDSQLTKGSKFGFSYENIKKKI